MQSCRSPTLSQSGKKYAAIWLPIKEETGSGPSDYMPKLTVIHTTYHRSSGSFYLMLMGTEDQREGDE